jgi:DNA gyrase inhibitor GyrI/AraC-like DNA-binding protein
MKRDYYRSRMDAVSQYIDQHLHEPIKIAELADIAHFSSFHFQRIYKAFIDETPHETISRRRLEKAVFLLKHHGKLKVQDIALQVGFGSIENFTRQFSNRYGFPPNQLRKDPELRNSRIYQEKPGKDFHLAYEQGRKQESAGFSVEIQNNTSIPVALIKAVFGADGSQLVAAYEQLMTWYESTGYHRTGSRRFGMSVDDPDVTPANQYRYDFAVATDHRTAPLAPVETAEIPGGLYAVLHCQGNLVRVGQAWDYLYKVWLPQSGYVPRHYPAIEEFLKGPEQIGWEQFDLLCKVPIKKMNN